MIGPSKGLCLSGSPWCEIPGVLTGLVPCKIAFRHLVSVVRLWPGCFEARGAVLGCELNLQTQLRSGFAATSFSESKRFGLISARMESEHLSLLPAEQCIS